MNSRNELVSGLEGMQEGLLPFIVVLDMNVWLTQRSEWRDGVSCDSL